MPIRPNTGSITRITSIPRANVLPHTGGAPNQRRIPCGVSHPHRALHLIRKTTSSTTSSPSNPLRAARLPARPRPRPSITVGRHPTSSCHHRFRFRNSSTARQPRLPFLRILGQTGSLLHKTTRTREGWIPSIGAGAARTISGFSMANKGDTRITHTTRCLRSPAESARTTLPSIITPMSRPPSTISPLCLHYPPLRSRINGHSMSRRIRAGIGRGRWMISICI